MSSIHISRFNVVQDLLMLFQKGEMSDVTFKIEGQHFAAHRLILAARSPVFKAEFFGSMAESGTKSVIIKDIRPDVFKSLLQYIYTDTVPDNDGDEDEITMTQQLLIAADRYAIKGLKLMCESKLCKDVSLDTVTSFLGLAEGHNCNRLKNGCLELIVVPQNSVLLMVKKEFIQLLHDSPYLLAEIEAKIHSKKPNVGYGYMY